MRILSVKGRPVTQLLAAAPREGGDGPANAWVFRREYRSTYRDSVVPSERVVSGDWSGTRQSPPRISVERDLAAELGVAVGDEIVWDVQGVSIPTRVGSLREVEWARFEPNFFVVFPAGALEDAPQSYVTLTRVTDAAERGRFQRRLAERFGNVSTLDLTLLQEALEQLVQRVVLAIRFMALFSLGVGVLVLVGALATSRFQRVREGALLRTLGATRAQVFRVVLAEYFTLGLIASIVALLLASLAGWAVSRFVFEGTFRLPALPLSALMLLVTGLTVIVGLANSRDVVRRPPLEVLRQD
jgi:putative ABC transport system permease protein